MFKSFCLAAACLSAFGGAAQAGTLEVTVVDAGGLPVRNAVVSVRVASYANGPARFEQATQMSQKNIQFAPGLLLVPVGANVSFPNFDRVRHHVYSFSKAKKFELKLYGRDKSRSVRFDQAGTVVVGCNIHDQMRGFIRVVDTPFAGISDSRGKVVLANLPAGSARIVVWHQANRARDGEVMSTTSLPSTGKAIQVTRLTLIPGR
jgi:plastocyanin